MTDEALIDRFYEAAAFPDRWQATLDDFAHRFGAMGAVIAVKRSDQWAGVVVSPSIEPGLHEYMASRRSVESPAHLRMLSLDYTGFIHATGLMTPDEWATDPLLTDWVAPTGGMDVASTGINAPSGDVIIVQLNRKSGAPEFVQKDLDRLDAFRPHLARAALLSTRWRLERLRAAGEALALLGLPALMINCDCRVLAANSLISDMEGYVRWLPKDRIAMADPFGDLMLRRALAELSSPRAQSVRSFATRAVGGDCPVVAHIMPTRGEARDLFEGAAAVLTMTPVANTAAPEAALIRGLFDLSPGEARVARSMTDGLGPQEIARLNGVGIETVRSQIKAVLAKTGTRRQAQAAALLRGLTRIPVVEK